MKWIAKQKVKFEKDELRRVISKVNWGYNKKRIKSSLSKIVRDANENGIDLDLYDYSDEPKGFGFDGINLQFRVKRTGNMVQRETEEEYEVRTPEGIKKLKDKRLHFDHHKQEGAVLVITYSAVGHVHIFISPSKSDDSFAKHKELILYHTWDAGTISDRVLMRCVKALFHYHRYTGVLHRTTWADKWAVRWLNTKMYMIEYIEPKDKAIRYSGLYIPMLSFIVAALSLCIAYLSYAPH